MYELDKYSKAKVSAFLQCLRGFRRLRDLPEAFEAAFAREEGLKSQLLRRLARRSSAGGVFPDLAEALEPFDHLFDEAKAQSSGTIVPRRGQDADFDAAKEAVRELSAALDAYLEETRSRLQCRAVKYFGSGKDRYQLEVPEAVARSRCRGAEWEVRKPKKGFARLRTPRLNALVAELEAAEERLEALARDTTRRVFERFDGSERLWRAAVSCAGALDCLLSLATASAAAGYCRPEVEDASPAFLHVEQGRHPMVEARLDGAFIPNDVRLGGGDAPLLLLSGPNMGGKSTLLRQSCLIAVMAQVGCFVPAKRVRMAPFDRLFTRLGASDRILAGQSTFFVELSECAAVLNHGTERSLCILDELGRGTSTFDGTAIAHAVVEALVRKRCPAMFATHYHTIVEEWNAPRRAAQVTVGHMACLSEKDSDDVTFLYRLQPGPSRSSYGINVARLAKIKDSVIELAKRKAEEFRSLMDGA